MKRKKYLKMQRALQFIFAGSLLAAMFGMTAQAQSTKLFAAPSDVFETGRYSEGANPNSLAVGDLDGDGDRDAVVSVVLATPGITVMLNNGNKMFEKTATYPLATGNGWNQPQDIQLSDFDGDNDLDVIGTVADLRPSKLYVWRNNGNATFAAPLNFYTNDYASKLIIADVNGDGFPDAIIANESYSSTIPAGFTVHLHNGQSGNAAAFNAPTQKATSAPAQDVAAADFNNDGKLDIAVAAGDVRVFLNTGNGAFGASADYNPAPNNARYKGDTVAARDLDNDGDVDLVGAAYYDIGSTGESYGAFSILRNNGNGAFGTPEVYRLPLFTFMTKDIETADLNGDGFADVVGTNPTGRTPEGWILMLSDGQGGFREPKLYDTGQWTYAIDTADVDNDGDRDVLTASRDSNALTFFENPGNGAFPVLTHYPLASGNDATETADIDNDGDLDIVTNNETNLVDNQGLVIVQKNNGNGTFAAPVSYPQPRDYFDMKLRDLNNDGFVDMVFGPDGDSPSFHLGFALNRGDGRFFPTVVLNMFSCGEGTVDAFDLDNDGDRDIVFTEEQACAGGAPKRIFIYRNDGNQTFVNVRQIPFFGGPKDLGGADLDGDGKIDLVTIHSNGIAFLKNLGNFNFAEPVISPGPAGIGLYLFELADLNRDGKLDVGAIVNQDFYFARVGTMMGNGDGTFQAPRVRTGATTAESMRSAADIDIGDVNGDSYPDLNITNYASNDVSVFLTNSDGSLRPQQRYGVGNTPNYSTVGDFDGDGKTDFATVVRTNLVYRDYLVILRNTAPGARRAVFDFDGDGKTDVSIFRPSAGEWWYLKSSNSENSALQFGNSTDKTMPADFTGDGKTDFAFWRPATGEWFILRSENGSFLSFPFGAPGDIPSVGDFDADGKADPVIFRPSTGEWFILRSSGGTLIRTFGQAGDVPVAADYDGDGRTDTAIYRERAGEWWITRSSNNTVYAFQFGTSSDVPVPGDYTGDGKMDSAFWRPSTGEWFILRSEDSSYFSVPFGQAGDIAAPGDYDGDGRFDTAVFRPSTGNWFVQRSTAGIFITSFGANGDRPISNAYAP